jgi:hypothetical protein
MLYLPLLRPCLSLYHLMLDAKVLEWLLDDLHVHYIVMNKGICCCAPYRIGYLRDWHVYPIE